MWPSVLEKFGPDQPAAFKGQDIGPGADLINEQGDIDISFLVVAAADFDFADPFFSDGLAAFLANLEHERAGSHQVPLATEVGGRSVKTREHRKQHGQKKLSHRQTSG